MPVSVCFTGHRHISENLILDINTALEETIVSLINKGATSFLNGGSYGFDLIAAEKILALKAQSDIPIKLIMVLPCKGHDAKWNDANKARLQHVLDNADEIICLSERYFEGCMKVRNQYLVEHGDVCIAYMTNRRSGAGQTVRLSRERGLKVINIAENLERGDIALDNFEKAFSDFIDTKQYDGAEESFVEMLFTTARSSFTAGWVAAGGKSENIAEVLQFNRPPRVLSLNKKQNN